MSNPKWKIGPVKLVNGFDAQTFLFDQIRKVYLGAYRLPGGGLYALEWQENGSPLNGFSEFDLAPPPKKTVRVRRWLVTYADGSIAIYLNQEAARIVVGREGFALFEIDCEVEEGEGL